MTFYTDTAAVAVELLTEFGATGTITRTTITGGGPSDPSGGTTSEADTPLLMAVFEVSPDRIDGTNIKAGDFQAIVQASADIEINTDDTLTVAYGGRELNLRVIRLGKIAPAGTVVAYDMVCRGG